MKNSIDVKSLDLQLYHDLYPEIFTFVDEKGKNKAHNPCRVKHYLTKLYIDEPL